MRIAIVGGGIGGLSALLDLSKIAHCKLYEKNNKIGGVWSRSRDNQISLQIEPRIYRFPDDPYYPQDKSGQEVQQYLERYIRRSKLESFIQSGIRVLDIRSVKGQFTLRLYQAGKTFDSCPYDWVICTGDTARPRIPELVRNQTPNTRPPYLHTSQLTNYLVEKTKGKHVVVLGGSKSAAEAVLRFYPHNKVVWIARKFYSFAKTTPITTISLSRVASCLVQPTGEKLPECLTEYKPHPGQDSFSGSFNFLTESDYQILRHQVLTLQGSVVKLSRDQIVLDTGQSLRCDLLICATGYHSNACPTSLSSFRLIHLKPKPQNIKDFLFFSHFCGYSIITGTLAKYIAHRKDQEIDFTRYLEGDYSIARRLYPLEYYLRLTLFPNTPIARFYTYSQKGLARLRLLALILGISLFVIIIGLFRHLFSQGLS